MTGRSGEGDVASVGGDVAWIGLGSNVGDRVAALARAAESLEALSGCIVARSSIYRTAPVDVLDQPEFLNQVLAVRTRLDPRALLAACLEIERSMGRIRRRDKGPREIDLDVLLFDEAVLDEPGLQIPHPRLHLRRFVLVPLAEIAPDLVHPALKTTIAALLARCPDRSAVSPLETGPKTG
ncbi:MAG TPA: 2-amino-4-hydroxy-6-hydroxymethyldihydropteridine diphosphokinase [Candidatus Polarisedimenticolia bacterium]|nr:2-amino-4-hydroxy-6-hydroxymethyldihydropteridine diphosphokinase [Candidatus Polarisedimenticolia bacterium]